MANNETTTKFKVDISELKKSMQEARKQVAYANSEFKAVSSTMDDWSKSSDGISAKLKQLNSNLKSQETVLNEYEKTLEEVKKEYGENSKEALEYATKLNNQRAVVNKIKNEISGYEDALKEVSEAEKIAAKTGQDVADVLADVGTEADDAGDGFTVLKGAVAEFVGNALTQLVDGLKQGISSLVSFSDEANKAMNNFQASTGATADDMAEFEGVMKNIYKGNYGESFEDIADAMATVKNTMGDWLGAEGLEILTRDALVLRDTFDFEVDESIRAVNSLINQFGIDGDYAFNLIAQGAQNGLNQNGDLLDVINEYSVQFASAGYEADDMFNMLANGAKTGTWSVDKLGDAVKEMNIRFSDGTVTDALEENRKALGLTQKEVKGLQAEFNEGGESAQSAVNKMIEAIMGVEDETERYKLGVSVFGTMWEDLGADAISALMDTNGQINMTKDSMAEINAIKYDSVGDAMAGLGRNLQTSILMPLGDKLLPIISDVAAKFEEWLNDPATQEGIKTLTDSVAEFVDNGLETIKEGVQWFLANKDSVIAGLAGIAAGFMAFKVVSLIQGVVSAMKGMTVAQYALNLAMSLNPIGIIVALIAGLIVAFISLWKNSESFRAFWINLWEKIKSVCSTAIQAIGKFFTETIPEFLDKALQFFAELPAKIWTFLNNVITNVQQWKINMITKALEMGLEFLNNVVTFFKQVPAKIQEFLYNALVAIVATMIAIPVKAYEGGKAFLENLISFFKQLPEKVSTWLTNTINKVNAWRTNMLNKAKEAGTNFLNNLIEFFKQLPSKVWTWLVNVVTKVTTWRANMIAKAKETALNFINKVIEYVKQLPAKVWTWLTNVVSKVSQWRSDLGRKAREAGQEILDKLISKVKEIPDKIKSVGSDVVAGLWNGISDKVQWLKDKISGFVGDVTQFLKDKFGIASPSKVMAKEVGKWLPEGIAVGISDNAKSALRAMKDLTVDTLGSARAGLQTATTTLSGTGGARGGVVNNFYQTINAPKQLSRLDIYRQTKNVLTLAGGGN